jgi:hypothetical protein
MTSVQATITFQIRSLPAASSFFMADSSSSPDSSLPHPGPLPTRQAPATPNRGVTGLLNRGTGSTPIPPSLQAKMAAVRSLFFAF